MMTLKTEKSMSHESFCLKASQEKEKKLYKNSDKSYSSSLVKSVLVSQSSAESSQKDIH